MDILTIVQIATSVIGTCSVVTSALPNKNAKANRIYDSILKVLNVLAFNFGNARKR